MNSSDDIITEAEYISDSILVENIINDRGERIEEGVGESGRKMDTLLLEKGSENTAQRRQQIDNHINSLNSQEKLLKRAALLGAGTYLTSSGINKHIASKKGPLMEEANRYKALANSAKHRRDKVKYLKKLQEIKKKINRLNMVERALEGGKTIGVQATLAGVGGQVIIDARKNSMQKKKEKL